MDVRRLILLLILATFVGCKPAPAPVRANDFASLYQSITFADNVVASPPPPAERTGDPPMVVNWFYAGTAGSFHRVVLRTATWNATTGEPIGQETRYDVPLEELRIVRPMPLSRDPKQWLPLHEAAPSLPPPPGMEVHRELLDPAPVKPSDTEENALPLSEEITRPK